MTKILSAEKNPATGWYHHVLELEDGSTREFDHPAKPAELTEAAYLARIRAEMALLCELPPSPVPVPGAGNPL